MKAFNCLQLVITQQTLTIYGKMIQETQKPQLNIPVVRQRFREFKLGEIVKYQWLNDKPLHYEITKVWNGGFGFFDLKITDEDKNYDGHFYDEYLSVTYRDLLDANVA